MLQSRKAIPRSAEFLSTPSQNEIKSLLLTAVLVCGGLYDRISISFTGAACSNWAPWLASAGYAVLCSSSSYGEAFAAAT